MNIFKILFFFPLTLTLFLLAQEVEISASVIKAENLKKEVHFSGNVKIIKGYDTISADEVIVYFDENNETNKYEAKGNVHFSFKTKTSFYQGKSKQVLYYPLKSLYILKGEAKLEDKITKRSLKGAYIKLNMLTGKASIKGTKLKPVKFTFDVGKK